MHIDVNNAFLSWEAVYLLTSKIYDKDIRDFPSVISKSTNKRDGIVVAKSDPAKKLGIKTADVIYNAYKKAPNLKIFEPHYDVYEKESKKLFTFLRSIFEEIEVASIDECYVDYTNYKGKYGNEVEFAYRLKDYVYKTFGWSINIGVANTKICAKMASDMIKPNKVITLYKEEVKSKMWPLPIDELYMAGKKSVEKLKLLKIYKIGDLACFDVEVLTKIFKNNGTMLHNYANGIDDNKVKERIKNKDGISISTTLNIPINSKKELITRTNYLLKELVKKLIDKGIYAATVGIGFRDVFYKNMSKQKTIEVASNDYNKFIPIVEQLVNQLYVENMEVRLISVRFNNLTSSNRKQLSIFDDVDKINKDDKLNKALSKITEKYGQDVFKKM